MDLALFSVQKFELFLLVLVRTTGIFTMTPIFGSQQVPMQVRIAVSLGLTMIFLPVVAPMGDLPVDMLAFGLMIVREACVGLVIGFVCSLVFSAIQIAGNMVDFQSGLAMSSMVDPVNGNNSAIIGRFQYMVAGLLFFVTNGHHLLIRGLADSFTIAPVGQLAMNPAAAGGIMDLFAGLFAVAIRIAVPIIAAVFLADIAIAITARIVPQMNVLIVGFPLKLGVATAATIVAVPVLAGMSQGLFADMYHSIGSLARMLAVH